MVDTTMLPNDMSGQPADVQTVKDAIGQAKDAIDNASNLLDELKRTIVVEVDNLTSRVLTKKGDTFVNGGFGPSLPAGQIEPLKMDVFSFEGSIPGVNGMVTYDADGIGEFSVAADNPFIGTNSVNVFSNPNVDQFLSIIGEHSSGNHNHARFAVIEKGLQTQSNWRNCMKCQELFFNGFADNKGRCPAGGGHEMAPGPAPFDFVLPRDIPPSSHSQSNWRNCMKCQALFFNGFADNKGRCPAGGGHETAGPTPFDFVLNHREG
jgi:hypothetical protein